jgi:hypothetical protein
MLSALKVLGLRIYTNSSKALVEFYKNELHKQISLSCTGITDET